MRRIGLTGGIGSGKSTVARLLADLGAVVIDADALAREVVEPGTQGLAQLVEAFGPGILTDDGHLNRSALAEIVFADAEARTTLNRITHPLIGARTAELIAGVPDDAVLVHDVPLLVELGMQDAYDLVLVVDAEDELRVRRLMDRGHSEADARARIAAQAPREQRNAAADILLDNSGSVAALKEQVTQCWPTIAGLP